MVASPPAIPSTMVRDLDRHPPRNVLDWFESVNLVTPDVSDPDFSSDAADIADDGVDSGDYSGDYGDDYGDDGDEDYYDDSDNQYVAQQESDAQRGAVFVESNMAQRPDVPRASAPEAGLDDAIVIQTVYKTLAPTFQGPIAGYSTMFDGNVSPTTQSPASETNLSPVLGSAPTPASLEDQGLKSPDGQDLAESSAPSTKSMSSSWHAVLGKPASGRISAPVMTDRTGLLPSASRPSSAGPSADLSMSKESASAESGSSVGVKTGIAFGVLGGVLAVVLIAFLLFNRRRKQAAAGIRLGDGDEKSLLSFGAKSRPFETSSIRGDRKAPRISLRPTGRSTPVGTAWDRRTSTGRSATSNNPFGIHGERVPSTITEEQSTRSNGSSAATLFDAADEPGRPFSQDARHVDGRTVTAGVALGAASSLSRKTSMHKDRRLEVDLTLPRRDAWPSPPSPADTEFSMSLVPAGSTPVATKSAIAIQAAGGPANSGVHRVELEFKPTLDDEMDMRVGDLVRLLHEYDDGWCLVIRLNRSRQGIVPRTCLSTRPVKPRLVPGAPRPGPPVNPSGQIQGPGSANGPKTAAAESSRLRMMQSSGSSLPSSPHPRALSQGLNKPGLLVNRPQSPGVARLAALPQPGAPPPGPPPSEPPPPGPLLGAIERKPVPERMPGNRAQWLKEPRPWAEN